MSFGGMSLAQAAFVGVPSAIGLATTGPGGAAIGAGLGSTFYNTFEQYRQQQYQRNLQSQIFNREDNSIQRRVADLQAAGLSKVLAAGSGANAGAPVSTTTPQLQNALDAMSMLQGQANIDKTVAENDVLQMQKNRISKEIDKINQDVVGKKIDNFVAGHDAKIIGRDPMVSNPSLPGKMARDLQTIIYDIYNGFVGGAKKDLTKQSGQQYDRTNKRSSGGGK